MCVGLCACVHVCMCVCVGQNWKIQEGGLSVRTLDEISYMLLAVHLPVCVWWFLAKHKVLPKVFLNWRIDDSVFSVLWHLLISCFTIRKKARAGKMRMISLFFLRVKWKSTHCKTVPNVPHFLLKTFRSSTKHRSCQPNFLFHNEWRLCLFGFYYFNNRMHAFNYVQVEILPISSATSAQ